MKVVLIRTALMTVLIVSKARVLLDPRCDGGRRGDFR